MMKSPGQLISDLTDSICVIFRVISAKEIKFKNVISIFHFTERLPLLHVVSSKGGAKVPSLVQLEVKVPVGR